MGNNAPPTIAGLAGLLGQGQAVSNSAQNPFEYAYSQMGMAALGYYGAQAGAAVSQTMPQPPQVDPNDTKAWLRKRVNEVLWKRAA